MKREELKKTPLPRKILLVTTLVVYIIYIGWRMFFTLPFGYSWVALLCGILLLIAEIIGFIEAISLYISQTLSKTPDLPKIKEAWYPDVDVLIATHNESRDLLFKTVNACTYMKYPDQSKVHIYICDDGNRPEIAQLAKELNVGYFGLGDNKHAKAGNLNNAIAKTNSPLIVTFDADMIPVSNFLMDMAPYFFLPEMKEEDGVWYERSDDEKDPKYKIGFIQAPQSFYNADLFQFNLFSETKIPNEQDFFFREINVGRNASNSPIYAGSNTMISREALELVGGIKIGTITEDFATGIEIQSKGYTCYAIDQELAHGLAPDTFKSLIKQRERWGRGCVQTLRSFHFLFAKLKLSTKLSYMTSLLYWWTFVRRFIYIVAPILYTVFGITLIVTDWQKLLVFWLPSYVLYTITLRVTSSDIRSPRWSNIVDTIVFPYLIVPIVLETLGFKQIKFAVTDKQKTSNKATSIKYALPHIVLVLSALVGLYLSVEKAVATNNWSDAFVIFWLIANSYYLVMAILFMIGRNNYRSEERLLASVDVEVLFGNHAKGKTFDVADHGFSFILKQPAYIPYDQDVDFMLQNDRYHAKVIGRIVSVKKMGEGEWKYGVAIVGSDEHDEREYLQLVYDRNHSLPVQLQSSVTSELLGNLQGQTKDVENSKRKLARMDIDANYQTTSGQTIHLTSYNFEYFSVDLDQPSATLEVNIGSSKLTLHQIPKFSKGNHHLYAIDDWQQWAQNETFLKELYQHEKN